MGSGQQNPRGCLARNNKNLLDVQSEIRDSSEQLLEDRFDPLGAGPLIRRKRYIFPGFGENRIE